MKKTSLLLAVGALLYGTASVCVAVADCDVVITPGMSNAEVLQVLDCYGVPYKDASTISAVTEGSEGTESGPDDNVDDVAGILPSYVSVDNSNPVEIDSMCGFQPNGAEMAEFPVTVNIASMAMFKKFTGTMAIPVTQAGIAIGNGWLLFEKGDTWDSTTNPPHGKWWLITQTAITKIVIDPLSKKGPVKYVFDIIKRPDHTVGSEKGWPITQFTPLSPAVAFTALYSRPVLLHPLDPPHDLYGTLEVKFTAPALGLITLPTFFTFRADTDCVLPVVQAVVSSNFLTLFGEGLVYVKETKADGSSSLMSTALEVMEDGVNTFDVSDLIAKLKAGSCYSLVNESSLGTNIPLEIDGVEMPDGQACL